MGVAGLWDLVAPAGLRVRANTLEGRVVAVDSSIWLMQFIKAMRDSSGNVQRGAHLIGFFRRICKLLFYHVRPVVVFDGPPPALKRATLFQRQQMREQQERGLKRAAEKLLLNKLKQRVLQHAQTTKKKVSPSSNIAPTDEMTGRLVTSTNKEQSRFGYVEDSSEPTCDNDAVDTSVVELPVLESVNIVGEQDKNRKYSTSLTDADEFFSTIDNNIDEQQLVDESFRKFCESGIVEDGDEGLANATTRRARRIAYYSSIPTEFTGFLAGRRRLDDISINPSGVESLLTMPDSQSFKLPEDMQPQNRRLPHPQTAKIFRDHEDFKEYRTVGENGEERFIQLPLDSSVDPEVFKELPSKLQYSILSQIRDAWFNEARLRCVQAKDNVEVFSNVQIESFLRHVRTSKELEKVKKSMADEVHAQITLHHNTGSDIPILIEKKENDVHLLSGDSNNEQNNIGHNENGKDATTMTIIHSDDEIMKTEITDDTSSLLQLPSSGVVPPILSSISTTRQSLPFKNRNKRYQKKTLRMAEELTRNGSSLEPLKGVTKIVPSGFIPFSEDSNRAFEDSFDINAKKRSFLKSNPLDVWKEIYRLNESDEQVNEEIKDKNFIDNNNNIASSESTSFLVEDKDNSYSFPQDDDDSLSTVKIFGDEDNSTDVDNISKNISKKEIYNVDLPCKKIKLLKKKNVIVSSSSTTQSFNNLSSKVMLPLTLSESLEDNSIQPFENGNINNKNEIHSKNNQHHIDDDDDDEVDWGDTEFITTNKMIVLNSMNNNDIKENEGAETHINACNSITINLKETQQQKAYDANRDDTTNNNNNVFSYQSVITQQQHDDLEHDDHGMKEKEFLLPLLESDKCDLLQIEVEMPFTTNIVLPNVVNTKNNKTTEMSEVKETMQLSPTTDTDLNVLKNSPSLEYSQDKTMKFNDPTTHDDHTICQKQVIFLNNAGDSDNLDCYADVSSSSLKPDNATITTSHQQTRLLKDDVNLQNDTITSSGDTIKKNNEIDAVLHKINIEEEFAKLSEEENRLEAELSLFKRDADIVTPEMQEDVRELLSLFGIPYINAPAEAEAQCAMLTELGLCDAVISDDSDSLVFGAKEIYRRFFEARGIVEMYDQKLVYQKLGLSQPQMIQLAMLLGCDYTVGVHGIGIVNAIEALRVFHGMNGLVELKNWATSATRVRDAGILQSDSPQKKDYKEKHKRYRFEWVFPHHFPDPEVWELFSSPRVDHSTETFSWGLINLEDVQRFLQIKTSLSLEAIQETLNVVLKEIRRQPTITKQLRISDFFSVYNNNTPIETVATIRSKRLSKALGFPQHTSLTQLTLEGEGLFENSNQLKASQKKKKRDILNKKKRVLNNNNNNNNNAFKDDEIILPSTSTISKDQHDNNNTECHHNKPSIDDNNNNNNIDTNGVVKAATTTVENQQSSPILFKEPNCQSNGNQLSASFVKVTQSYQKNVNEKKPHKKLSTQEAWANLEAHHHSSNIL